MASRGERGRLAAAGGNGPHFAQARVGPADIGQLLAVSRPRGVGLHSGIIGGQTARFAAGHRLDPELAQRLEHHRLAIGRDIGPARHLGFKSVRSDSHRRARRIDHAAGVGNLEGNDRALARGQVNPVELAASPDHQAARIRRPGHVGIDPGDGPGLLHVHVERVIDLAVFTRRQVADIEPRLGRLAADIGDLLAVGRRGRPHRAAFTADHAVDLAGLKVIAFDREELVVAVLRIFEDRTRRGVAGVVDVLAIGGEDRLAQFLLVLLAGALDEQDAVAAGDVVHPDLTRAERAPGGEVLLGDDVLPVRAPARLVEQAEALVGQLALVAAVAVHDPDVVAAAAVGGEGDPLAIGREARLGFVGQAFRDPGRRAAADRHGIDVAQEVEGHCLPVRADIEVHPGAFLDRDRHFAHLHPRRGGHVPLGRVLGVLGQGGGGQSCKAQRQGKARGGTVGSLHR